MERKPDIIRAVMLIFAAGLVITGITSLQASEESRSGIESLLNEEVITPVIRD